MTEILYVGISGAGGEGYSKLLVPQKKVSAFSFHLEWEKNFQTMC